MLDRLPPEILVIIGEHLDQTHSGSLLDLACVNKHCCSVLTILLYRTLKFYVENLESEELAKDVTRYSQLLLHRVGGFGSVRRVIIVHSQSNETLGSLPRLKYLYLDLDASELSLLPETGSRSENFETCNDPTFNDFDQQYCDEKFDVHGRLRNGHLRDAFIKSALDHDLARNIFHTISSVQTTCMLEYMEVKVTGAGYFDEHTYIDGFHDVLETLGRPRRVSRVNNSSHETKVELPKGWRPYGKVAEPFALLPCAKEIFQRIWPAKTEKWWEEWHSFPLTVSAD